MLVNNGKICEPPSKVGLATAMPHMPMLPLAPGVPMYHQIAQVLRSRLNSGDLGAGNQLATEHALCEEFGVSRTTVRHALSALKEEGLLSSRRGVGTKRVEAPSQRKYVSSPHDPLHATLSSKPRVISLGLAAAPLRVANFLQQESGSTILKLVRLHELDGAPLSVVVSYMPASLADRVTRAALREPLHTVLWHDCGIKMEKSIHTIGIARADTDVAELLEIGLAEPVMHVQASTYLADGVPIRWTDNYLREDRYEYTAEFMWPTEAPRRRAAAERAPKSK